MKKLFLAIALFMTACVLSGCYEKVPAGNVGVRVDLYGSDKGVQQQVVGVGGYWLGLGEELYLFPTSNQLQSYKDAFTFQTSDSMNISAKIGIEYVVDPSKVATIFQTYRKGINEVTNENIRLKISDALINRGTMMNIDQLAAGGKSRLLQQVADDIRAQLDPIGIKVIKLSWTKDLDYPKQVTDSINAKIKATQDAQLRENEVAQTKAEAQKAIERAKGEAESVMIKAKAEADAISLQGQALKDNPQVLQLEAIKKWHGNTPAYVSGTGAATMPPFVQFKP